MDRGSKGRSRTKSECGTNQPTDRHSARNRNTLWITKYFCGLFLNLGLFFFQARQAGEQRARQATAELRKELEEVKLARQADADRHAEEEERARQADADLRKEVEEIKRARQADAEEIKRLRRGDADLIAELKKLIQSEIGAYYWRLYCTYYLNSRDLFLIKFLPIFNPNILVSMFLVLSVKELYE